VNRVQIGLGVQGNKRPGDYAALARMAEGYGFDVLSVFGDFMFQPPIAPLLEMAAAIRQALPPRPAKALLRESGFFPTIDSA